MAEVLFVFVFVFVVPLFSETSTWQRRSIRTGNQPEFLIYMYFFFDPGAPPGEWRGVSNDAQAELTRANDIIGGPSGAASLPECRYGGDGSRPFSGVSVPCSRTGKRPRRGTRKGGRSSFKRRPIGTRLE